ncbi:serine/threonine protein kinase [bacterium]|nr:serine/threonine protein kinase [bacterium]
MPPRLRLLCLEPEISWLPSWKGGRLVLGSSPDADAPLAGGLLPFHCLVALVGAGTEAVSVHDISGRGDVRDAALRPVPASGLRVRAGERFHVGPHMLALVNDDSLRTSGDGELPCIVCGSPDSRDRGQRVAGERVCVACLGVPELAPDTFPGYELVARLGQGSMGSVFLALARPRERLVALKAVLLGSAAPRAVARFLREARVLLRLEHPHIVRVLDASSVEAGPYVVCELVRGGDALARLARGPLAASEVARIGAQLADALDYAHSLGVVHRDVKPANVLLEPDGRAKLSDFGLAKELREALGGDETSSTGSGVALGTIAYAAPEQLEDGRSAGPPADIFGLGATLYHLATGRTPRETRRIADLRRDPLAPPPPASSVASSVPRALSDILARTLATDAKARPTARELREMLGRFSA